MKIGAKRWNSDTSNYNCSNCGEHVGLVHKSCPKCRVNFVDQIPFQKTSTDKITCPNCTTVQQNDNALYCIKCGVDLFPKKTKKKKYCNKCGTIFETEAEYCYRDGSELINKEIEIIGDDQSIQKKSVETDLQLEKSIKMENQPQSLGMNYYNIITWIFCPLGIVGNFFWFFYSIAEYEYKIIIFSYLVVALITIGLMYGLYKKMSWSWKLYIGLLILNSITGIFEFITGTSEFYANFEIEEIFIIALLANSLVTFPTYIYFNKRRELFIK